jgi:hypothetical protein
MKILALSGKMGTGKSYISDRLHERGWYHLSISQYLKEDLLAAGFSEEMVYGKGLTARTLRQSFGAARREDTANYYVDRLLKWLKVYAMVQEEKQGESIRVVIDDVRYPNELAAIRQFAEDNEGVVLATVRIERPGLVRLPDAHHLHSSETALDHVQDWDLKVWFGEQALNELTQFAVSVDSYEWWANERDGSASAEGNAAQGGVG